MTQSSKLSRLLQSSHFCRVGDCSFPVWVYSRRTVTTVVRQTPVVSAVLSRNPFPSVLKCSETLYTIALALEVKSFDEAVSVKSNEQVNKIKFPHTCKQYTFNSRVLRNYTENSLPYFATLSKVDSSIPIIEKNLF